MRTILIAMVAAGALAGSVVQAQDATKKCMGCHDMEKKKVGPAFKDVAAKYKGNKAAEGTLVAKLKEGKGHMKISGSDDEIKAAVGAALSAK